MMNNHSKPSLWQIFWSVLGALFGVQSSKVRERDFTQGAPWWIYVLVGLVIVVMLVVFLAGLAKYLTMSGSFPSS